MAAGKPLERYATLVVGNFRVDPELKKAGFPAGYEDVLQKSLFARLLSERVFPQVVDGSVGAFARDSPATPLIAEGEVADFSKGNRAARV
ncbi:MAG TPA: hypothetical protein VFM10_11565, partial [Terriglobales bacterium]|nr:hypothetical protein [Terriglobales bacterium]